MAVSTRTFAQFTSLVGAYPDADALAREIAADPTLGGLTFNGAEVNRTDSDVDFHFASALTGPQESALTTLVGNHTGDDPLARPGTLPHVIPRSAAPTATDDADLGIAVGDFWVDDSSSPATIYACTDATVGAAVWDLQTGFGTADLIKISNNDTTADYLENKLVATGASWSVDSEGGNEKLRLTVSAAGSTVNIQEEGTNVTNTPHGTLNFISDIATASDAGSSVAQIDIPHRPVRQLVHNHADDSYTEVTRTSGRVTAITVWTNSGKTDKIQETLITRTSGLVSQVVCNIYDTDGSTILETYTENTFNRTNGKVDNFTGTLT